MTRTIEISASFTGVISTGSYENEKPFFSVKEIIEGDDIISMPDGLISDRQKQLHDICYQQFKRQAEVAYSEKIAKTYQNIRFYDGNNGVKYPSVTSVIGWDSDFHMPPEELSQYGARGTIIHKQVEIFLRTGEWKEPKDIPEIYPDLVTLKGGNLGLQVDNVDFQAFYKDYPFKVLKLEETCLNHEFKYGGRVDIKCVIESANKGKWGAITGILYDVPTLLDIKSGEVVKVKVMKQLTAYGKCDPEIQQIGVIPLKKDNVKGYAKPILETDMEKYWALFKKDLFNFKQRYGI